MSQKSRIFSLIVAFLLIALFASYSQELPEPETRGVWITANYLKGQNAIETMVKKLSEANFNTLFIDTWYSGATLYSSAVVSNAGGPVQHSEFSGKDYLREVIDAAHKYNMEVFAWMEFGMAVGYGYSLTDAPGIIKKHPDWSMVSRDKKIAEADPWGGYLFWIDPAVNAAADLMVDLYTEVVVKYPDIDGIELDRMRYPYTDFSYSDSSRAKFVLETGYPDPLTLPDDHSSWAEWRRKQVTKVVDKIYRSIKKVNPQCVVTGAVVPPYMMYGGDDKLQAWDVWAKNSYVDILEPMLYLPLSDFSYQLNLCKKYVPDGFQLAPGIDIYSAGSADNTITEIDITRKAGMSGEILWYYGYLSSDVSASLKSGIYKSKTSPAHNDLIIDDASRGRFKTTGTWSNSTVGYKGVYKISSGTEEDTAIYSVRILREGNYSLFGYWGGDSSSNSPNVNVLVITKNSSTPSVINQQKNLNTWNLINVLRFSSGDTVQIKLFGTGGKLVADAFRFRLNPAFSLSDYVMNDNCTILMKFSNNLLNPVSEITKIYTSMDNNADFSIDDNNKKILKVNIEPAVPGQQFTLTIKNLLDTSYDTLSISLNFVYTPDKTEIIIDDTKQNSFWKLLGIWSNDTNYTATGNSYWFTQQSDKTARVQWGPYTISESGYYDVYASIPEVSFPLSELCFYIIKDKNGTDTVTISQADAEGSWVRLGNLCYNKDDNFSVLLTSRVNSDSGKYIVADAVKLKRALESTNVDNAGIPDHFIIYQNYPNPFNPETTISFSIKEQTQVYIKVYNVVGQEIARLADGENYNPGIWKIVYSGSNLSSGIYFAKIYLKSNNYDEQRVIKMILLK